MNNAYLTGSDVKTFFYAASTNGFYCRELHGSSLPPDAVKITHTEYQDLLVELSNGKELRPDSSGYPYVIDPEPPIATISDVRREAHRRIEEIVPSWMMMRALSGGKEIPEDRVQHATGIRSACSRLEGMSPIPRDYAKDDYWLS